MRALSRMASEASASSSSQLTKVISKTEDDSVGTGILPVFRRQAIPRGTQGCSTNLCPGPVCGSNVGIGHDFRRTC
jgi:hypothetical protein